MGLPRWRTFAATAAIGLTFLALSAGHASAQGNVSGRVTAEGTGQPLSEARVLDPR